MGRISSGFLSQAPQKTEDGFLTWWCHAVIPLSGNASKMVLGSGMGEVAEPDSLSSIPGTHMVEEKMDSRELLSDLHMQAIHRAHTSTPTLLHPHMD